MRTLCLGAFALLLTAGCTHEGKLRPQVGAIPVSEEENAAVTGAHGVRLVARGSSWQGRPQDLERHFTLVEIRLENHSGRSLNVQYDGFELVGQDHYVARQPQDLGRIITARAVRWRPPRDVYGSQRSSQSAFLSHPPGKFDMTYNSYNGLTPYGTLPCYTCPSMFYAAEIPSPDMLRLALREGPLEDGHAREGFLYFEEPLRLEDRVDRRVKLVDAHTGEEFGALRVPFEVH
jgi:hypothetical protein